MRHTAANPGALHQVRETSSFGTFVNLCRAGQEAIRFSNQIGLSRYCPSAIHFQETQYQNTCASIFCQCQPRVLRGQEVHGVGIVPCRACPPSRSGSAILTVRVVAVHTSKGVKQAHQLRESMQSRCRILESGAVGPRRAAEAEARASDFQRRCVSQPTGV